MTDNNNEKEVGEPEKKGGFSLFAPLGDAGEKKDDGKKDEEKKTPFSGSLFGSKPTGSLFGNSTNTNGTSLFGNTSASGGLFGNKPAFSGSLFGNNGTSDNKEGKSLFGGNSNGLSFLKPGTSSLFGGPPKESLFGQNKSIFGEGFGK